LVNRLKSQRIEQGGIHGHKLSVRRARFIFGIIANGAMRGTIQKQAGKEKQESGCGLSIPQRWIDI
jgi:hypothetical protein